MAFRQLYYTSCEVGLSGYPGFQFNAASDGIAPEVMRRVESLTAYDPPSSLPYNAGPAAIAACPVNLCFEPAVAAGTGAGAAPAVLANVVFVGNDYSNRFGNYFAHALVTADPAADLTGTLPIELWRAPLWSTTAVTDPRLPELPPGPARGRLDRGAVEAFLRSHPGRGVLPALLSATVRVVTGERRTVILVERDSEAAAAWIAAVSYLLPPDLAGRMSFATYHHRPAFSDLHLVATVPEADVDRGDGAFTSFLQFDLLAGRTSEVSVQPWAVLIAEAGVERAGELWATAEALAGGIPRRPDEWYPLLAAALLRQGAPARPPRAPLAQAAAAWLAPRARRAGAAEVERIGGPVLRVLADERPAGPALLQLADAASRAGAETLALAVERLTVDLEVEAVLAGAGGGQLPDAAPLVSPRGLAYAADRCTRALHGVDEDTALDLLGWAADAGLALDPDRLYRYGENLVGPVALARPDETTRRLMAAWPELRDGVVSCLAREAERRPDRVVEALVGVLGDGLSERAAARTPALREAHLIARSRRDPELRVAALTTIGRHRLRASVTPAVGADLLRRIWPHGAWSPAEARHILAELDNRAMAGPAPLAWLDAVLTHDEPAGDTAYFDELEELCREVEASPAAARLSVPARTTVARMTTVGRRLAAAAGPGHQAEVLTADLDRLPAQQAQRNLGKLTVLVDQAEPLDLPEIFAACPVSAIEHYLLTVRMNLAPARARADVAARLCYAEFGLRSDRSRAALTAAGVLRRQVLGQLEQWRSADLRAVGGELRRIDRRAADDFARWRALNTGGWLSRTLAQRRVARREDAPRRAAEKKAAAERRAAEKAERRAAEKKDAARRESAAKKTDARKKADAKKADAKRSNARKKTRR